MRLATATLVVLLALAGCANSQALERQRLDFWRVKVAQDLHTGMPENEISAWAAANHIRFDDANFRGKRYLVATVEDVPERFSVLTTCKGWRIYVYIYLDDSHRMTRHEVRPDAVCL